MQYRQIFTDGRKFPQDPNPTWNGYWSDTGKVTLLSSKRSGIAMTFGSMRWEIR